MLKVIQFDNNFLNRNENRIMSWIPRFMRRHQFVFRMKTKISQHTPEDLFDKIHSFHDFINRHNEQYPYPLNHIGNMDQTPIWIDMVVNRTITKKGEKTVRIRTGGKEKDRVTVVLAITADGSLLPPVVIFKGKRDGLLQRQYDRLGEAVNGVYVRFQEKAWMDEEEALWWYQNMWNKRSGICFFIFTDKNIQCRSFSGIEFHKKGLLVVDSLKAQTTKVCLDILKNQGTLPTVIPGGLTSVIQPLDVCINKPFKKHYKQLYFEWLLTHESLNRNGTPKAPERRQIINWVKEACDLLQSEMIQNSFLKCGIVHPKNQWVDNGSYAGNGEGYINPSILSASSTFPSQPPTTLPPFPSSNTMFYEQDDTEEDNNINPLYEQLDLCWEEQDIRDELNEENDVWGVMQLRGILGNTENNLEEVL